MLLSCTRTLLPKSHVYAGLLIAAKYQETYGGRFKRGMTSLDSKDMQAILFIWIFYLQREKFLPFSLEEHFCPFYFPLTRCYYVQKAHVNIAEFDDVYPFPCATLCSMQVPNGWVGHNVMFAEIFLHVSRIIWPEPLRQIFLKWFRVSSVPCGIWNPWFRKVGN